jgi:hypothetical protein
MCYEYSSLLGSWCLVLYTDTIDSEEPTASIFRTVTCPPCTAYGVQYQNTTLVTSTGINSEYTCMLQPSFQPRYNSFRKPAINLVTFVCMKQLDSHSADFREIRHWEFLLTYVSRIHFTHRSTNCHVGTSPYTSA